MQMFSIGRFHAHIIDSMRVYLLGSVEMRFTLNMSIGFSSKELKEIDFIVFSRSVKMNVFIMIAVMQCVLITIELVDLQCNKI